MSSLTFPTDLLLVIAASFNYVYFLKEKICSSDAWFCIRFIQIRENSRVQELQNRKSQKVQMMNCNFKYFWHNKINKIIKEDIWWRILYHYHFKSSLLQNYEKM